MLPHTERKAQKEPVRLVSQGPKIHSAARSISATVRLLDYWFHSYFIILPCDHFPKEAPVFIIVIDFVANSQTTYFVCHSYCVSFTHLPINCSFTVTFLHRSKADEVYVNNTFDCTLYGKFYRHPGIRKTAIWLLNYVLLLALSEKYSLLVL